MAACQKPSHVRFSLAIAGAPGTGEVVIRCMHCDKQVVITISRVYIEADALVRGLPSRAFEGD